METPIRITADDGVELEGLVAEPAGAKLACLLCHPHPLYGGDMHNNVVSFVAHALQTAKIATLRFNFRGVGRSGGSHGGGPAEVGDAASAVAALAATGLPVAVAGYSFGASIALRVANVEPSLRAAALVAPPLAMFDASFAKELALPLFAIVGDRDAYCPAAQFADFTKTLTNVRARTLTGADHFFGGREGEVAAEVVQFLESA